LTLTLRQFIGWECPGADRRDEEDQVDYPISTVARLTGTTSRALRHYGDIGLLPPSRVGTNGYRYYDSAALVRLQRILLLRNLGLSLPAIAEVVDDTRAEAPASVLRAHLEFLRGEQERLDRQITAVLTTVEALERGEEPMPEDMFDGFDHTRYRDEVEERWGREAYAEGDAWWRGKSQEEKDAFGREVADLNAAWTDAASRGIAPTSEEAVALAGRHVAWLTGIPGTPRNEDGSPHSEYVRGLGEMYVGDPRFAANYGGRQGAELVRAALAGWLDRQG
jgi:DNA-binding transcriptional MerR regulator